MGEWGVIAALAGRMPPGPLTSVGIGDDAAVVGAPSGSVVAAVDLLLEGRHFRRDWSSAYDIGVKAAARSLADIAAMGAVNTALLVALAVPGELPARWPLELADGLASEAARAGAGIVGGDTARADSVLLSVTALGDLAGRRAGAPLRRQARRRDRGGGTARPFGGRAGAAVGRRRRRRGRRTAVAGLIAAHRRPSPPYAAGPEAAALGATAMIDVSDGLLADLGHVADASAVALDLDSSSLVTGGPLSEAAAFLHSRKPDSYRTDPADSPSPIALDWVLTGGEDHSLVATFPASSSIASTVARHRATSGPARAPGVTVDGAPHAGPAGWQHFR